MSTHFGTTWVKKTRKNHRCGWCGTRIEAGSAASHSSGVSDGDFWSDHYHPECQAAIDSSETNQSLRDDLYDGWIPGDWARGRTDDDFGNAPQFSADYRGKEKS